MAYTDPRDTRQTTMFDPAYMLPPIALVEHVDGETLQQRFERFHEANPHVYQALVSRALALRNAGARRISMGMLFEVLRHDAMMQTGGDTYKLNNDYRSRYARLIMERTPALAGAFSTRKLTTE